MQLNPQVKKMKNCTKSFYHIDNGGRRTGLDRREFSYTNHLPERRLESDRRSGNDRRIAQRVYSDK